VAQRLRPVVLIGKQGLTPTILAEIDSALDRERLVKVKFSGDREAVREGCSTIESEVHCVCVGGVGKTASFFREKAQEDGGES